MLEKLAILFAVASISGVQAQSLYVCDGLTNPYWPACDFLRDNIDWSASPYDNPPDPGISDGFCRLRSPVGTGQDSNCIIAICNDRGDGGTTYPLFIPGESAYDTLVTFCKPENAGGRAPGDGADYYVRATNNPDSSRILKRKDAARNSAVGQSRTVTLTIEEYEEFLKEAAEANMARLTSPGAHNITSVSKRSERPNLHKRESWKTFGLSRNVKQRGVRNRMTSIAPPGVVQTWSTTKGYSTTVTASVSMSAGFWGIFTASVGIDVSQEFSIEHNVEVEFDPAKGCEKGQTAKLYYYPLFDHYNGAFSGDEEARDIYIPVEDLAPVADVECLG